MIESNLHQWLLFVNICAGVHFRDSSLSADRGRVSEPLRVVERVPEVRVVEAAGTAIIILVRIVLLRLLVLRHETRAVLLLELLVNHLLIPHLLVAHLLAHFLLQIGDLLLQALLHLLLDNPADQRSQMNWHRLEVLELVVLRRVLHVHLLDRHFLLLRRWLDLSLFILCLDWNFLLLWRCRFHFLFSRQNLWSGLSIGRFLPKNEENDPIGQLTSGERLSLEDLWVVAFQFDEILEPLQNLRMHIVAIVLSQILQKVWITHNSLTNLPGLLLS